MIAFDLRCAKDHVFEVWFKDSASYEEQVGAKAVVCPACGDKKISKAIMAPNVASGVSRSASSSTSKTPALSDVMPEQIRSALRELRSAVEANSEYVGNDFSEEARKIHYGESEARGIHGEASESEAEALQEEGVEIARIPWVENTEN
jgi:hypothetical protein